MRLDLPVSCPELLVRHNDASWCVESKHVRALADLSGPDLARAVATRAPRTCQRGFLPTESDNLVSHTSIGIEPVSAHRGGYLIAAIRQR
jgi:hypothetical protein